jgi:transglutaminase-like putative cysteine protease
MPRPSRATLLLLWAAASPAVAQEAAFAVTPATLDFAGDAPAVTRTYESRFVVQAPGRAREHVRLVTTALAPGGREAAGRIAVHHDAFRHVRELSGVLRDASGRTVRRLGRSDVADVPASTESFFDDLRLRVAELYGPTYPFTVEWTYEVEHTGILGWPTWYPQRAGLPLEHSAFQVEVPADMPVRHRSEHLRAEPSVTSSGGRTTYAWEVVRVAGFVPEPLGPAWQAHAGALYVGTSRFEIGGAAGAMESWSGFGAWYRDLSAGRTELPQAARAEVARLVAGVEDDRERARLVYDYLQRTTRYVSVQLGLGGWQPAPAADTFQRRYGDCKALTTYLIALLGEAGIRAYPALIRAGRDARHIDSTFTTNVFNHVVVRAELSDGPLWLEATSPTAAFGHLGSFTSDRLALLVSDAGGRLVRTPAARPADNRTVRSADVRLDDNGGAIIAGTWDLAGDPRDAAVSALAGRPPREREAWALSAIPISGVRLVRFGGGPDARPGPAVRLEAEFTAPRFAARAGSRLLIDPNVLGLPRPAPAAVEARSQPVHLGPPSLEVDSVRISIPAGYALEAAPAARSLETSFGRYERSISVSDGELIYARRLELDGARLPAEDYESVRTFLASVARWDTERVALARSQ